MGVGNPVTEDRSAFQNWKGAAFLWCILENNVIFDLQCACDQSRFCKGMRNYEFSRELLFACVYRNAISIVTCDAQLIDEFNSSCVIMHVCIRKS